MHNILELYCYDIEQLREEIVVHTTIGVGSQLIQDFLILEKLYKFI